MEAAPAYREWMKQDLGSIIDTLDLSDLHKHFLRSRWLDTLLCMDGRANQAKTRIYVLRLTAIIGGVIVPALVSVKMNNPTASDLIGWSDLRVELLVALVLPWKVFSISASAGDTTGGYRNGSRWKGRNSFLAQRRPVQSATHTAAYPLFAERVEVCVRSEVDEYVTNVVQERPEQEKT